MKREPIVFIGGTWSGSLKDDETQWWEYWRDTFANDFIDFAGGPGYAFQWSGDLKASRWRWNKPWKKAAEKLVHDLDLAMIRKPIIMAHSHGGNVALEALAMGLDCEFLITLATPPRAGVPSYDGPWANVVGTRDWVVRAGMLLDGRISTSTAHKGAVNIVLPGETHTSVHEAATWNKHQTWTKVMEVLWDVQD